MQTVNLWKGNSGTRVDYKVQAYVFIQVPTITVWGTQSYMHMHQIFVLQCSLN